MKNLLMTLCLLASTNLFAGSTEWFELGSRSTRTINDILDKVSAGPNLNFVLTFTKIKCKDEIRKLEKRNGYTALSYRITYESPSSNLVMANCDVKVTD